MKETLRLQHFPFFDKDRKPDITVEVEYRRLRESYGRVLRDDEKEYEIVIDGEVVGRIDQVLANTTSPLGRGSRLVRRNKGTLEWSWSRPRRDEDGPGLGQIHNLPGLYAKTRREAAAKILGYDHAEKL